MIPTETNKNAESFDATKTFSVPAHTAQSLKSRINQANKQSLQYKNNTANRNQSANPAQPGQHAKSANPANAHTPQTSHASQVPQTQANAVRQSRPQLPPVQNRSAWQISSAGQTSSAGQNHPAGLNASETAPALRQPAAPVSSVPAAAPIPQTQPTQVQPTAQPAQIPSAPAAPTAAPASAASSAPAGRQIPAAGQSAAPVPQTAQSSEARGSSLARKAAAAIPSAAPADTSGIVKRSAEVRSLENMQMAKTRSVKVTSADTKKKAEKKKKKEKEYTSDEGGNTVVSVVKAIVYIIFVIIVSVALAIATISVGNDVFAFVKSDEAVDITIPEYATLDEVSNILYQNDIIKYPRVFKLYSVFKEYDQDFLAGDYTVNGMMNYDTLLTEFKEKPVTGTVRLTIPEGYTVDEIINLFVENGIGTREEFVRVMEEEEFDYWFLREQDEKDKSEDRIYRLEGYLFPDTYEFYKSSSEYTVVNKMLKRFGQIFSKEYRKQCEELGYTVDQIVTLASLIEKEAGSPSEFFLVSSVFHNRLGNPWGFPRLESDATVAYLLQHENNGVRVAVKASDLYLDNPYNTYQSEGLPPGPIANPSASAMLAALSPQATPYYYFVANAGKTYFSATRAEHEAYIAQFKDPSYVAAIPKADIPGEEISGGVPLTQQENWKAVNAENLGADSEKTEADAQNPDAAAQAPVDSGETVGEWQANNGTDWQTNNQWQADSGSTWQADNQWQPDNQWQSDSGSTWQPDNTADSADSADSADTSGTGEWQSEQQSEQTDSSSGSTDNWFTSEDWYYNP